MKRILTYLTVVFLSGCVFDVPSDPVDPINKGSLITLVSPSNNAVNQLTSLQLKWEGDNFESFDVYFGINRPPEELYANDIEVKTVAVFGLEQDTRYYWQVVGKLPSGELVYSALYSFVTNSPSVTSNQFVFQQLSLNTEPPAFVNMIFQVVDINNIGINSLTESDFIIYEDGQLLSQSESLVRIRKKDETPYILKTVLMLDNSASVFPSLTEIKDAANSFITGMTTKQEMAIYTFSDKTELIQDFTTDKQMLFDAISSIGVGFNTTNLYGAIVEGASRWTDIYSVNGSVQGALIIFTDGKDTQGSVSYGEALIAVSGKRVYTIGLGNEIEPEILSSLGTAGFYSISNAAFLTQRFLAIQATLEQFSNSFYQLSYLSPKRGNFDHTVRVRINNNLYFGNGFEFYDTFSSANFYSVLPGIYINASFSEQLGIDAISLREGETVSVIADAFFVPNESVFTWSSTDNNIVDVVASGENFSVGTITAKGSAGSSTSIIILDFNNDLSKILKVNIVQ